MATAAAALGAGLGDHPIATTAAAAASAGDDPFATAASAAAMATTTAALVVRTAVFTIVVRRQSIIKASRLDVWSS